jgi:hypothetical protein
LYHAVVAGGVALYHLPFESHKTGINLKLLTKFCFSNYATGHVGAKGKFISSCTKKEHKTVTKQIFFLYAQY